MHKTQAVQLYSAVQVYCAVHSRCYVYISCNSVAPTLVVWGGPFNSEKLVDVAIEEIEEMIFSDTCIKGNKIQNVDKQDRF